MNYLHDIMEFHAKFELFPPTREEFFLEVYEFRQRFLLEELVEMQEAWLKHDLEKYLDALVDLDYVNIGTYYLVKGGQSDLFDKVPFHKTCEPTLPTPVVFTKYANMFMFYLTCFFEKAKPSADPMPVGDLRGLHTMIVEHSFSHGLNFPEAWDRVHTANMKKQKVRNKAESTRRSMYDVVKPPGWEPADLKDLVS